MVLISFNELPQAKEGKEVEKAILRFFWHRLGYIVVPLSKIEDFQDKGPRFYVPPNDHQSDLPKLLIAPDFLGMRRHGWCSLASQLPDQFFFDAKSKGRATWYRTNEAWQSGIDRRVWKQYLQVDELTRTPMWVLHLIKLATQEQMDRQRAPIDKRPNPTGLYAHPIIQPIAPDPFDPYGTSKLVYWKIEDMIKIAELDEVIEDQPWYEEV